MAEVLSRSQGDGVMKGCNGNCFGQRLHGFSHVLPVGPNYYKGPDIRGFKRWLWEAKPYVSYKMNKTSNLGSDCSGSSLMGAFS